MVCGPSRGGAALTELAAQPRPRAAAAARRADARPAGRSPRRCAAELAAEPWLVFCCGRYEGIDARVIEAPGRIDEVSLGDYVLAGGEAADAGRSSRRSTRLLPGVLGNAASAADDSFAAAALLEAPVYTRPPELAGRAVPDVLLSGDHGAIARWRRRRVAARAPRERRPDLLDAVAVTEADGTRGSLIGAP